MNPMMWMKIAETAGRVHAAVLRLGAAYQDAKDLRNSARLVKQAAYWNLNAETENVRRMRAAAASFTAQQIADFGASGVQLDGSVIDVLAKDAGQMELDSLTKEAETAYAFDQQMYQVKLMRQAAHKQKVNAWMRFNFDLLNAGTGVAGPEGFGGAGGASDFSSMSVGGGSDGVLGAQSAIGGSSSSGSSGFSYGPGG